MTPLRIVPCPEPDILDDLDAFESVSLRIDFPTEAERKAYLEGWADHARIADEAQRQRDAASLDMRRKEIPRCECGQVLVCFTEYEERVRGGE